MPPAKGFSAYEDVGIGIVNPRATAKAAASPGTEVFSLPFPGYGSLRIAAVHHDGRGIVVRVRDAEVVNVQIGSFDDAGFRATDPALGDGDIPPEELLCLSAMRAVEGREGPLYYELVKDGYWKRFLDELPGLLVTGGVHLS